MDDPITLVKQLTEFGFLAFSLYLNFMFWRAYDSRTKELIDTLREVAGLRAQLAQRENRLYFPRENPEGHDLAEKKVKIE